MENIGAFQFQTKDNYLKSTMLNDHFKGSSLPSQFILVSPSLGVLASQNKYIIRYQNDENQSWKWNFLNWNIHSLIPQNDDEIS